MEKMTYEAMSKRYLARGDISPEKLAQRLGEYESTGLEPQEVKELQLRFEAAQAGYDDQKHYAAAYKDKAEELEEKHWEECRQIALYDDELRKAKELLQDCYDAIDPDGHEGLMVEIEGALK